jgi:hypothetical protein
LIGLAAVWLMLPFPSRPSEEPFKFNVSRYTNSATGVCALVEMTNTTRMEFTAMVYTQAATDTGWQRSSLQPHFPLYTVHIYGRWTHRWLIPMPMESAAWRLEVQASRAMNKQERSLDSILNRAHLYWPFHRNFYPLKPERVVTSQVFKWPQVSNQSRQPTPGNRRATYQASLAGRGCAER